MTTGLVEQQTESQPRRGKPSAAPAWRPSSSTSDSILERSQLICRSGCPPLFLRIADALDATETFKQKRHQLGREGFDPATVTDALCLRDPQSGAYRALDADAFADVASGTIRL